MLNPSTHLLIIEDDKGRKEYTLEESVYFDQEWSPTPEPAPLRTPKMKPMAKAPLQKAESTPNRLQIVSASGLNQDAIARLTQRLQSIQLSPNVNGFLVFEFYISKRLVQQLTINQKASSVKDQTVIEAIRRSLLTWHSPQATVDKVCLVIGIQP
ncbi:MAG: after-VIT domain-containing protein [Coleofasciculus sp. G3-WIS-01]|uniref:after-VIT domain-containing protein n=1 Tax=Coleofasciculus sp. G3-WIS-01 TaxID=3069528 RepID=UPI0033024440